MTVEKSGMSYQMTDEQATPNFIIPPAPAVPDHICNPPGSVHTKERPIPDGGGPWDERWTAPIEYEAALWQCPVDQKYWKADFVFGHNNSLEWINISDADAKTYAASKGVEL